MYVCTIGILYDLSFASALGADFRYNLHNAPLSIPRNMAQQSNFVLAALSRYVF